MEPIRTVFTDSYNVPCPHGCGIVRVDVMRERGGKVVDVHLSPCSNESTPIKQGDRLQIHT